MTLGWLPPSMIMLLLLLLLLLLFVCLFVRSFVCCLLFSVCLFGVPSPATLQGASIRVLPGQWKPDAAPRPSGTAQVPSSPSRAGWPDDQPTVGAT